MISTAHVDTFARDNLPPREQWPELIFDLPELRRVPMQNAAVELLDRAVERGWGARRAIVAPGGVDWTFSDVLRRANRIAQVLIEDLGLLPGNRVLLRGFNSPMMAACWFAIDPDRRVVTGPLPAALEER